MRSAVDNIDLFRRNDQGPESNVYWVKLGKCIYSHHGNHAIDIPDSEGLAYVYVLLMGSKDTDTKFRFSYRSGFTPTRIARLMEASLLKIQWGNGYLHYPPVNSKFYAKVTAHSWNDKLFYEVVIAENSENADISVGPPILSTACHIIQEYFATPR